MRSTSYQIAQISSLSFNELQFLRTLHEERSITNTAKKFDLTVPAASRLLKKLRDVFEDPLFVRSSPLLIPTERMDALAEQIDDILQRMQAMAMGEVFDPATLEKTFRIAAVDNGILVVLRDFLAPFYGACPNSVLEFQFPIRARFLPSTTRSISTPCTTAFAYARIIRWLSTTASTAQCR